MTEQKKVLVLDFDGVICDSLDECLITAVNAHNKLAGRHQWVEHVEDVDSDLRNGFRKWRGLVRPAGEYGLLMILLTSDESNVAERFEAHRQKDSLLISTFEKYFFECRRLLRQRSLERWSGLHKIYREFADAWPELRRDFQASYILTTKDRDSVLYFNEKWALGFQEDEVFSKDNSRSKPESIRVIAARHEPPCEIHFVDDHPAHLQDVAAAGAECYWAAWGYTPADALESNFHRLDALNQMTEIMEEQI